MICVVIGRTRHKMMLAEMQEAAKRGARMIELRLDFLSKAPDFKRLLANKSYAVVATLRRQADGGRWSGPEESRRMLLKQAIVAGVDYVDLETDVADEIRRFRGVKRIVSYHNLAEVPADLEQIHARMCQQDPDVVKVAVAAQRPSDTLRVLNLIRNSSKPTVALCMGEFGFPSRLLGAKFGMPYTYAAFNKERIMAPGMPTFDELKGIYQYDAINADTQVFGVIGDPIAHSLSPLIHNRAMRKVGFNGVYLPFRVPREELAAFLKDFEALPVQGYSVTIPHKESAAELARSKDAAVEVVGAANTLVRGADGFGAFNTDFEAALESIRANLPPASAEEGGPPSELNLYSALILGAGGVARAVAHALHRAGARVTLSNRTLERAQSLAEEVDCRYVPWEARHGVIANLLVNCTSVGMFPYVDESPVHHSYLKPGLMVFDTVYTPESTLLVKEARARGCHVLTGVDMFVRQAALQFRLFTGREAPLEVMASAVRRALSPLTRQDDD